MNKDFSFSIICKDITFKICPLLFWTHTSFYNISIYRMLSQHFFDDFSPPDKYDIIMTK